MRVFQDGGVTIDPDAESYLSTIIQQMNWVYES